MRISKSYIVIILCIALMVPALVSAEQKKLIFGGKKKQKEQVAESDKIEGNTITLDEFLIPLADEKEDHTVKLIVALEFIDEASTALFAAKKAAIRDSILCTVGVQKHAQLKKVPDRIKLRQVLKEDINKIFGKELVAKVYFSGFVLQ